MAKKEKKFKPVTSTVMKDANEDTNQIKKFIVILVGIAVVSGLLYLVSSKVLVKDGVTPKKEVPSSEEIDYVTINAGNILNRPYDEYYVLAYDPESLQASEYSSYIGSFDKKDSKMYFLDLGLEINEKYKGKVNKDAKTIDELSLETPTLIKVNKGKIVKILDKVEDIEKEIK